MRTIFSIIILLSFCACSTVKVSEQSSNKSVLNSKSTFLWENANVYFLLTDRFKNGNKTNDVNFNRTEKPAVLRGFEGGDLRGIIQKLEDNYFTDLGINAIWMTPIVEQIHAPTNEGTGNTYAFHGYWAKDWTTLDPNFGTEADLKELVEKAHAKGIRILLDAVINHTGPVTEQDEVWPANWVRTEPQCDYQTYATTIDCTLVKNLPDILTNSQENVDLPPFLVEKWKKEGRLNQEVAELNEFFDKTGYPRAPKYYIMKWLADYIIKYGIDGYRVDTVKHTEEDVWADFADVCQQTFDAYNQANPDKFMGNKDFFLVGEVYGYGLAQREFYHYSDQKVNYFENGFPALINFDFKSDATQSFEALFSQYSDILNNEMQGKWMMNYLTSHDDGSPFDLKREMPYETGTKLLLSPGISQVYYGDETARPLKIKGAEGDANLRSFMEWEKIKTDTETQNILEHYQKLGQFRIAHPSVGAGVHKMISESPYWFSRTYNSHQIQDKVIIGLDLPTGKKSVNVSVYFPDGKILNDAYSGQSVEVKNGSVSLDTDYSVVLLAEKQ